ncbi:MAG TPA: hypothetical protein VLA75_07565 [Thermoanaerobaculia bacterium]|nr:hypothetical protein [Thermoanaerobaculia bacterium]
MDAGPRFGELLQLLARHGVEHVVVGAAAAVLGGAPMTTFDLDVVFEPGAENRSRLLAALAELDAVYWDPLGGRIRPDDGRLVAQRHHLLETRLGRLDLMREIGRAQGWPEVRARSHELEIPGLTVRVLDLEAVIESKEAAGREKDRAALPLLRETLRQRRARGAD